ncbi:MAG: BatD family protein, partial [bacterium]|nr:BatD family protein [bacterium]
MRMLSAGRMAMIALLLVGSVGQALAEMEFHASVDRARASQSEPIQLTLTLTSSGNLNHVPSPTLDLSAFDAFGPSLSTRLEMVNGRSSFSRELVYSLYGKKL